VSGVAIAPAGRGSRSSVGGYFLLAFGSPFRDVVKPHLLTSVAIVESYHHIHPDGPLNVMELTRLPQPGAPVGPASLSEVIPDLPAPQFIAVAGEGPEPIIFGGNGSYVPASPNRFYTFECSAHAAFALAIAGIGGLYAGVIAYRAGRVPQAGRS
jgi:hypothetical protein